jgi:hypothetical protein
VPEKGDDHHGAQGDGGAVAGGVLPGGKGEVRRHRRQRRRRVRSHFPSILLVLLQSLLQRQRPLVASV